MQKIRGEINVNIDKRNTENFGKTVPPHPLFFFFFKKKTVRLQKKALNSYEKPILLKAALPWCPLSPYNSSSP